MKKFANLVHWGSACLGTDHDGPVGMVHTHACAGSFLQGSFRSRFSEMRRNCFHVVQGLTGLSVFPLFFFWGERGNCKELTLV